MDIKEIEYILERYWNCKTSVDEEKQLKLFFSKENIPEHLLIYKDFFSWEDSQSTITISNDFEDRIMGRIHSGMGNRQFFYPFLKIAASVLIILSASIGIYTQYMEDKRVEQTYSETFSDPEQAMKEAQLALDKVSSSLFKGSNAVQTLLHSQTDTIK